MNNNVQTLALLAEVIAEHKGIVNNLFQQVNDLQAENQRLQAELNTLREDAK